jgi:hypothetical protein
VFAVAICDLKHILRSLDSLELRTRTIADDFVMLAAELLHARGQECPRYMVALVERR